jgi:hypothetical protein
MASNVLKNAIRDSMFDALPERCDVASDGADCVRCGR